MAYIPGRGRGSERGEREEKRGAPKPLPSGPSDIDLEKLKRAYEDLEQVNKTIRESQVELILNLAIAAEYKDPETGNHILRISDYASELGAAAGLSADDVELIRYASPMHDIGKIGIPDRILQKPGKLTPEEWDVMRTHPTIGWRMFHNSKSPLLRAVASIAISHHEKFDGTGYPYGLKGKDIPIFGRIVALVDVFDAIVSKRCYKEAWTFEQAQAHIRSLSGNHLDPDLVETFCRVEPSVRKIYDANVSIQQFIEDFREADERLSPDDPRL